MKPAKKTFGAAKCLAAIAVLLGVWLVYELANDPYELERTKLLASLEDGGSGSGEQDEESLRELDYAQVLGKIGSEGRLWGRLVGKKPPAPKPPKKPDLKEMIRGLKVLTVLSANNEIQVIISDSRRRREDIYKKGDKIRKLTIDGFTSDAVALSYKGETIKLPF